jgi:DNA topoisomerase-2
MARQRQYEKTDQLSHILKRPDTYVGAVKKQTLENQYLGHVTEDGLSLELKEYVRVSPALIRIFVEILSNALDNIWRSKEDDVKMSKIKVIIDDDTISIFNDGSWIPIEIHDKENLYIPELIFGELLTSSNYNDDEERYGSGRNGLGGKLTNIFSTEFSIEVISPTEEGFSVYRQKWSNNMKEKTKPKITHRKSAVPSTKVTWKADFARFNCTKYGSQILGLYKRYVFDSAMVGGSQGVSVYFNGRKLPISNLKDYARLFSEEKELIEFKSKDSIVVLVPADSYQVVAFTNGICNPDGGVHVDTWANAIFKPLLAKFNKKGKPQVKIADLRKYFLMLVKCDLPNPEFTSQSKTKLASPRPVAKVSSKQINAIAKWSFAEDIRDLIKAKEFLTLKKTEKRSKKFQKIPGYDPANLAGTKESPQCICIFTEGLSAKTYGARGIEKGAFGKSGRDWFGLFPLRGKMLNVRNSKVSTISKNKEITNAISALGLRFGVDYTEEKNFKQLNYGKVALLCDADVDGVHICGLLLNFFHTLFPSLLQREEPYVVGMETPIVRIYEPRGHLLFYTEREVKEFDTNPENRKKKRKYYKGLGTSNNKEVMETFGERVTRYYLDEDGDESMSMVFDAKNSDKRKEWLSRYNPRAIQDFEEDTSITRFINERLIEFSIDDCGRSIPNILDGLKESQRKILYAVFKKKLKYGGKALKVAQLAGYVAEQTDYHHGETCLYDTIVGLANDIIGKNNLPYFFRDGQYGTRLSGGKDASAGRYIFTKLDQLTRLLFPEVDDDLLPRIKNGGEKLEPKFYIPIIPTVLLNGCSAGIGTGWSCSIPLYNPRDLIKQCLRWIEGEDLQEIHPWYRNFKGRIKQINRRKSVGSHYVTEVRYETSGVIERKRNKIKVSELPIGMWTDKFKEFMEDLLEKKEIKSLHNYSTPQKVHFEITEHQNGIKCNLDNLKLKTYITNTNMVLFHPSGKIKKFGDGGGVGGVQEIITLFCTFRMKLYEKRKKRQLEAARHSHLVASQKYSFLAAVMNDELVVHRRKKEEIETDMEVMEFVRIDDSFDYLLRLNILSFTEEKLKSLHDEIQKVQQQIEALEETEAANVWKHELEVFLEEYDKWEKKMAY